MVLFCGVCAWISARLGFTASESNAEYHFRQWQALEERPELIRALKLNPRYSEAWIAMGLAAESMGDRKVAEASLHNAAAIDRAYLPKWTLANYYLRAGDMPRFWASRRRGVKRWDLDRDAPLRPKASASEGARCSKT